MYDKQLLDQLSKAVGVKLSIRDNDKLMDETIEHRSAMLERRSQAARDSGVVCVDEECAVDRFYDGANRKD